MSHSIIIIGAKLKCVSNNFEGTGESVDNLKQASDDADAWLTTGGHDPEIEEQVHDKLEFAQITATDWCDNGAGGLTVPQMCDIMDGLTEDLTDLIS